MFARVCVCTCVFVYVFICVCVSTCVGGELLEMFWGKSLKGPIMNSFPFLKF